MTSPYIVDPGLLASLVGQQYLVIRPTGPVADFYAETQAAVLTALARPLPHPLTGHITLRGFREPERVAEVRDHLAGWATTQRAIDVEVDAVDGFPAPFQVLFARVERSAALVDAYASLTTALEQTDLTRIGELDLAEWVFHLSLVYAHDLDESAWRQLRDLHERTLESKPNELIQTVDFVWYDELGEHTTSLPLMG